MIDKGERQDEDTEENHRVNRRFPWLFFFLRDWPLLVVDGEETGRRRHQTRLSSLLHMGPDTDLHRL